MEVEEFEIEWIPESTEDALVVDLPACTVEKINKKKPPHPTGANMGEVTPEELQRNPHSFEFDEGISYFKQARLV